MVELFAKGEDPDQTPLYVASDLCLHCANYPFRVSRLQWVNKTEFPIFVIL